MTDKIRNLLEDVQTVYEGKGMVVHPNSFDRLRMEVIKLDNTNKQQSEQIEKMKCCGNCRCASHSSLDGTFCGRYTQYNKADDKCKWWEIR